MEGTEGVAATEEAAAVVAAMVEEERVVAVSVEGGADAGRLGARWVEMVACGEHIVAAPAWEVV